MTLSLPLAPLFILHRLQQAGYEAYIVGGAVRDLLLRADAESSGSLISQGDFDFTTNATPEQIQALFPESFYENEFGTVAVPEVHLNELMRAEGVLLSSANSDATNDLNSQQFRSGNELIDLEEATKIHISLQDNANAVSQHATVKSEADGSAEKSQHNFEMTTFRSEGTYSDHRRPDEVKWGQTLQEDLTRRDFTINAMAISVPAASEFLSQFVSDVVTIDSTKYVLTDLFNGLADLHSHTLRTVGSAEKRFEEDALRMLRAIRFAVQLNMTIADEAFAAIQTLAPTIEHVSWERVRDELMKMLASQYPAEAIELLDETGLLQHLLPEVLEGKGVMQGGHHTTDVWTHSIEALRASPSTDPVVRLATLLHDVGKPRTHRLVDGKPTFYAHEIVGSRMAKQIALRLRLSRFEVEKIFTLVRHHMFYYQPQNTDASIRRFMRKVGLENINDILDLREADRLGSGSRQTSWRLEEMKQRMVEQLHQPFSLTDMAVNGSDLMSELGLKPGPQLGQLLQQLFEKVLDEPELNQREVLLAEARKLIST